MREKVTNKKPVRESSSAPGGLEEKNDWVGELAFYICMNNNLWLQTFSSPYHSFVT